MEPTVIEYTRKCGNKVYEMAISAGASLSCVSRGGPIERRELESWREVPLDELKGLFPDEFQRAYDCVTDPSTKQQVYFMGPSEKKQ